MDAAEPGVVAGHAAEAFDAAGVRYLVGGSVASTLHGEPRGTLDVDFAVHLGEEQVDPLAAALEEHFIVDVASIAEAAAAKRMFNAIHAKLFIKADVHVRAAEGHSLAEMDRALVVELPGSGRTLRVATPEDTALRKLWWYRAGGESSDRQWQDVRGVLRGRREIDRDYLDRWSGELGVTDLLARALAEL
ncbi:MAG: hypothetical protein AAFU73_14485 [Planctomycetota bacterium]